MTKKNISITIYILSIILFFFFVKNSLTLPFYWDSSSFLIPASQEIAINFNLLSYTKEMTDYPHTFLLPLILSFFFKVFSQPLISIHVFSVLVSLLFLIIIIKISKEFKHPYVAPFVLLSLVTNPLFIAQTDLVYFEIIGGLFKLIAIYYLNKKKYKKFAVFSITSFLIRFENGFILSFLGLMYYFFIKKSKKILIATFSIILIVVIWFLIHYLITNWWFYSPERYFDENHLSALIDSIKYLFLWQGRYAYTFIGLIGCINLFVQKTKQKENNLLPNKQLLSLLILSTIPVFLIILKLGYFLPRYILPTLPVFYILVFLLAQTFSKTINKLLLIILLILPIFQTANLNNCYAYNFEDCLYLREILNKKQQAIEYLDMQYNKQEEIYTYYEDDNSMKNLALGYTNKKSNIVTKPSKNTKVIYITPTSSGEMYSYAKENNFKLINQLNMNKKDCFQPKFLIKNCQNNHNTSVFIFAK